MCIGVDEATFCGPMCTTLALMHNQTHHSGVNTAIIRLFCAQSSHCAAHDVQIRRHNLRLHAAKWQGHRAIGLLALCRIHTARPDKTVLSGRVGRCELSRRSRQTAADRKRENWTCLVGSAASRQVKQIGRYSCPTVKTRQHCDPDSYSVANKSAYDVTPRKM